MASSTELRLNRLQMLDLGTARREYISTDERKINAARLEDIEANRMSNMQGSEAQRLAKANNSKIEKWKDMHKCIGDTQDLEVLDSLLDGQTHRLRLNAMIHMNGGQDYTKGGRKLNRPPRTTGRNGASTGSGGSMSHASRDFSGGSHGGSSNTSVRTGNRGAISKPGQKRPPSPRRNALDPAVSFNSHLSRGCNAATRGSHRRCPRKTQAPAPTKARKPLRDFSSMLSSPESFLRDARQAMEALRTSRVLDPQVSDCDRPNISFKKAETNGQKSSATPKEADTLDNGQRKVSAPTASAINRGVEKGQPPVSVSTTEYQQTSKSSKSPTKGHYTAEQRLTMSAKSPIIEHLNTEPITENTSHGHQPLNPSTPTKCPVGTLLDFDRMSPSPEAPLNSPGCEDLQGLEICVSESIKQDITRLSEKLENAHISSEEIRALEVLDKCVKAKLLHAQGYAKGSPNVQQSSKPAGNPRTPSRFNAAVEPFIPSPVAQGVKPVSNAIPIDPVDAQASPTGSPLFGEHNLPGRKGESTAGQEDPLQRHFSENCALASTQIRHPTDDENRPPAAKRSRFFSGGLKDSRWAN